MPLFVMVLNDGETYTDLDGCLLMEIPDHVQGDAIDEYVKFGPKNRIVVRYGPTSAENILGKPILSPTE